MATLHISLFLIVTIIFIFLTPLPRTTADTYESKLRNDTDAITEASIDYGNMVHENASSVLNPSSVQDIIDLIRSSYNRIGGPFTIAARGTGHSVRGQAMTHGGVVVNMTALSKADGSRIKIGGNKWSGFYADVGAEQKWIDVLRATLEYGKAPVSWTDYLYLSVGGTLSNAGISGQSFSRGPQITNVIELDVITGKGQFFTCSRRKNIQLFYAVLGGLGQFGIITRARIVIDTAPTRVKRLKLLYSDFFTFTSDQEYLISTNATNYVEGFLITNEVQLSEWNISFSQPSDKIDLVALLKKKGVIYYIELAKYYNNQTSSTVDHDIVTLLDELSFVHGYIINEDVAYFGFLNRLGKLKYPQGPLDTESHPWLNIFIPRSSINDFNDVLSTMIPQFTEIYPVFIIYPFNQKKWDNRMSAVIPKEDVFYVVGLLHWTRSDEYQVKEKLNDEIMALCEAADLHVLKYLPQYTTTREWAKHYGMKWITIRQRKLMFDPKRILSPGQRMFN